MLLNKHFEEGLEEKPAWFETRLPFAIGDADIKAQTEAGDSLINERERRSWCIAGLFDLGKLRITIGAIKVYASLIDALVER